MKLLSSYFKELKIAARGFYFYIEVFVAVILLLILLLAVDENPISKEKEYLFNNFDQEILQQMEQKAIDKGSYKIVEPTELELKPASFTITNRDTGEVKHYNYTEAKTVEVKTVQRIDEKTNRLKTTAYHFDNEEDMIWMSYQEKAIGATTSIGDDGRFYYKYYNQGYETSRFIDTLYILHNEDIDVLNKQADNQVIKEIGSTDRLNNRENIVPIFLTFAGALMGYFIVAAYVFLDRAEGVIKAFAVTPTSIWTYLMSKILVECTTVIVSSAIIVIPIMGAGPNYALLFILLLISTFAFAAVGLLMAAIYENMNKSVGVLFAIMMVMLLPVFSYLIPMFDPVWLRVIPTYGMLQGFKEILLGTGNYAFVWMYCGIFLVGGVVILAFANHRFKKTLMV